MIDLTKYVYEHTVRGECQCGKCIDRGDAPDPEGHTIDMVFFKVAVRNNPTLEEFKALTVASKDGEFCSVDPFDGWEHSYLELGAWIGDQGMAMLYMALGASLGAFDLLGISGPTATEMAKYGFLFLTVKAKGEGDGTDKRGPEQV